jgi:hypothetical protein
VNGWDRTSRIVARGWSKPSGEQLYKDLGSDCLIVERCGSFWRIGWDTGMLARPHDHPKFALVDLFSSTPIITRTYREATYLAEFCFRHRDTVEALTNAKVRSVGRDALLEAAASDTRVSNALSTDAIWAAIAAEDQSTALRGRNATEQLALFFLEMDARLSKRGQINLPMRRQHIADYCGLTIETVSRTISRFRRSKIIQFLDNEKLQRRVVIRDRSELSRLAPDASDFAWWKRRCHLRPP